MQLLCREFKEQIIDNAKWINKLKKISKSSQQNHQNRYICTNKFATRRIVSIIIVDNACKRC